MTGQDDWKDGLKERVADEVDYIKRAFARKKIDVGIEKDGKGVGYLYAKGELLVLEEYLEAVRDSLTRQEARVVGEPQRVLRGLGSVP